MKIDVDFDVFKTLTARRQSEQHTDNAVLRELLGLPTVVSSVTAAMTGSGSEGWTSYGVTLPNGTELRGTRNGKCYVAKIVNGQFTYGGETHSPSSARQAITQTGGNGWWFWTVEKADGEGWEAIWYLRDRINPTTKDGSPPVS
jgi:hypothetical protein